MTRFALVAATLLASTSAFAGDVYDFKIGGQSIHIEQPRHCNSASCVTVSIPGIYEQNTKRQRPRDSDDDQAAVTRDKKDIDTRPAPTDAAPVAPASPAPRVATAPSDKSLEPANGPATGLAPPMVAAVTPPPVQPASPAAAASPLGVWLTEEREGKVRIEECGGNLCGYAIDAKTNANGETVLINMKPGKDKWSGKIHDPNSGSNYDSTIAMKGSDRLRVQGCAFGGMFCGGQTWTRAN